MNKNQPKILIISGRSKDVLVYKSGRKELRSGGPIFWIEKTLQNIGLTYKKILAKADARVEIKMPEEKGKIISCGKIKIANSIRAAGVIISTIGDEFDLKDINKVRGAIALDVQGFVRTGKSIGPGFRRALEKIAILKATQSELRALSLADIRDQKKRILIITRGGRGFDVFSEGRHYIFKSRKMAVENTIGAGDVLLTAFTTKFLDTGDPETSGRFALDYVTEFIKSKAYDKGKKNIRKR